MRTFERKGKEAQPILAICYDFDKTLSPDDMQAQGFIQAVGYDVADFWKKANGLAETNEMDQNLAYMYLMMTEAKDKFPLSRSKLEDYGAKVGLFPGVEDWFERIRAYGQSRGVKVEHYIISSGLKEMIEGTMPARKGAFEKIYASSFYFDEEGTALWPAQVVNYTNKTQFLFRIEKGVLDVNDPAVNAPFAQDEIRVPFRNIVYIGDSDTDIPCMRLISARGGHSIGVYNGEKAKVLRMMRDGRIRYFAPADYRDGSELDSLVKAIVDRTAANEKLEETHFSCERERRDAETEKSIEEERRSELIDSLRTSPNFATTHMLVFAMDPHASWTEAERERLAAAALENSQVRTILHDSDIEDFFRALLAAPARPGSRAAELKALLGL